MRLQESLTDASTTISSIYKQQTPANLYSVYTTIKTMQTPSIRQELRRHNRSVILPSAQPMASETEAAWRMQEVGPRWMKALEQGGWKRD